MRPSVLVVEDDGSVRALVGELLREDGLNVSLAADGTEALKMAVEEHPDLAVLDILLPDVDGPTLAQQLRRVCGPELPILAMTAEESVAKQAFEMAAYSLLEKPFELDHLLLAVRRGLLERDQRRHVREDVSRTKYRTYRPG